VEKKKGDSDDDGEDLSEADDRTCNQASVPKTGSEPDSDDEIDGDNPCRSSKVAKGTPHRDVSGVELIFAAKEDTELSTKLENNSSVLCLPAESTTAVKGDDATAEERAESDRAIATVDPQVVEEDEMTRKQALALAREQKENDDHLKPQAADDIPFTFPSLDSPSSVLFGSTSSFAAISLSPPSSAGKKKEVPKKSTKAPSGGVSKSGSIFDEIGSFLATSSPTTNTNNNIINNSSNSPFGSPLSSGVAISSASSRSVASIPSTVFALPSFEEEDEAKVTDDDALAGVAGFESIFTSMTTQQSELSENRSDDSVFTEPADSFTNLKPSVGFPAFEFQTDGTKSTPTKPASATFSFAEAQANVPARKPNLSFGAVDPPPQRQSPPSPPNAMAETLIPGQFGYYPFSAPTYNNNNTVRETKKEDGGDQQAGSGKKQKNTLDEKAESTFGGFGGMAHRVYASVEEFFAETGKSYADFPFGIPDHILVSSPRDNADDDGGGGREKVFKEFDMNSDKDTQQQPQQQQKEKEAQAQSLFGPTPKDALPTARNAFATGSEPSQFTFGNGGSQFQFGPMGFGQPYIEASHDDEFSEGEMLERNERGMIGGLGAPPLKFLSCFANLTVLSLINVREGTPGQSLIDSISCCTNIRKLQIIYCGQDTMFSFHSGSTCFDLEPLTKLEKLRVLSVCSKWQERVFVIFFLSSFLSFFLSFVLTFFLPFFLSSNPMAHSQVNDNVENLHLFTDLVALNLRALEANHNYGGVFGNGPRQSLRDIAALTKLEDLSVISIPSRDLNGVLSMDVSSFISLVSILILLLFFHLLFFCLRADVLACSHTFKLPRLEMFTMIQMSEPGLLDFTFLPPTHISKLQMLSCFHVCVAVVVVVVVIVVVVIVVVLMLLLSSLFVVVVTSFG
jgi:hypothetical protein